VLICIAQSVPTGGNTTGWMGLDRLAERSGYSRRQVQRLVQSLELLGEVEVITPDDTGGPGYVRPGGFRTRNGRGLANKYRLRLAKGDIPTPFVGKGDKMAPIDEKGDKTPHERVTKHHEKGDIAMSHQSIQRITEGGGGTPPAPPCNASQATPSGINPIQDLLIKRGIMRIDGVDANGEPVLVKIRQPKACSTG